MLLEPLDDFGALAIPDEGPIDIADKTNIGIPPGICYGVIMLRVERVRHLHNAAHFAFVIQVTPCRKRQLRTDIFAADLTQEPDLLVQQVILITEKRNDWRPAVLKRGCDLERQRHVVTGG